MSEPADPHSLNALFFLVIQWSLQGKRSATNHFIYFLHIYLQSLLPTLMHRIQSIFNTLQCVFAHLREDTIGLSDGAVLLLGHC